MALIFGNKQLSALFENAGAALLEFAERAESNRMQGRFFEAMGLIQRGRPGIEHAFGRRLAEGFDNLGRLEPRTSAVPAGDAERSSRELSLVEPDEMEELVAAENLIIRAGADFFPELFSLSQRLAVINDGQKLKEYEIPAGPHQLVHSFQRSIAALDVEVKIKVILYALFDSFVIKQAKSLYDELNGSLQAAGILPDLRPIQVRSDRGNIPTSRRPWSSPQSEESRFGGPEKQQGGRVPDSSKVPSLGAELLNSIIELMSTRHSGTRSAGRKQTETGMPLDPAVSAAETRELVSAIHKLQSKKTTASVSGSRANSEEISNLETGTAFIERIKETLNQEREQVLRQIDRDKLASMDSNLIDLIGMLFQYMLNDPVLPNLAKALLSYLHTPYLKVAIVDRRLLVDARHPARRLLDQLVEAGSLWVDESNPHRGIFPAMQQVVDRVLQELSDDVSLFRKLLSDFERVMSEQQRRTDTMEQRTQEAARGREKLQLAKRRANQQIQLLIQEGGLPQPIVAFLSHTWSDRMVFILLRDRDEDRSDAWKQAVATAEALVALFNPQAGPADAERRARASSAAQVRGCILEGVRCMGNYSHAALDSLFELLASWEPQSSSGAIQLPAEDRRESESPPNPSPLAGCGGARAEEITELEQEVIRRLRTLKFGTWFELRSDIDGSPRRIKLSWLSPLTATCMFVDRSGMQAEIKTLQELAQDILSGRAKVIPRPKHPFIERTLVSIRKMLQSGENRPSTSTK